MSFQHFKFTQKYSYLSRGIWFFSTSFSSDFVDKPLGRIRDAETFVLTTLAKNGSMIVWTGYVFLFGCWYRFQYLLYNLYLQNFLVLW